MYFYWTDENLLFNLVYFLLKSTHKIQRYGVYVESLFPFNLLLPPLLTIYGQCCVVYHVTEHVTERRRSVTSPVPRSTLIHDSCIVTVVKNSKDTIEKNIQSVQQLAVLLFQSILNLYK